MGGGFRKRRDLIKRKLVVSDGYNPVNTAPTVPEPAYGISPEMIASAPISGGQADTQRVRIVKDFFARLPESVVIFQEHVAEVEHNSLRQEIRYNIFEYTIPENRTFFVDNVLFFATPLFGSGLVPEGVIEAYVQCYFEIGKVVPVGIESSRVIAGATTEARACFPFLNDRVGAREVTFSLIAKSGRKLSAYYVNRGGPSPIALATIGIRVEGWLADSNIIEEILGQQR